MYNYIKEELEDSYAYLFQTDLNKIYTVSFDSSIYAEFLEAYPSLLQEGYGLSFDFESYGLELPKNRFDERVGVTIHAIIAEFLENKGKNTFILYHCQSMDGKQAMRAKLFDKWFSASIFNCDMFKNGLEVEINISDTEKEYHYIGFICNTRNKYKDNAIGELEKFSVDLVNVNKSGTV